METHTDFIDLIENMATAPPDLGIVLVDARFRERSYSYRDLLAGTLAAAARFTAAGVRPGQMVLVSLAARLESLCSFFGLVRIGAVPVSVPSPLLSQDREAHRQRISDLARRFGVGHILESEDLCGIAGGSAGLPQELGLPMPDLTGGNDAAPPRAAIDPDDVAFVQFSSGSTSHPKGVRITHRNLLYNLRLIVDNDRRTADSVVVSWLPLCHDMGLVGCLLSNLILKNRLILMDPLCFMTRPVFWLAKISDHRGTTTAVPNFALDVCTERITDEQLERHGVDLGSFRYLYCGSEPVSAQSIRRFEDRFSRYGFVPGSIYPVYGMSETTLIATAPDREASVVSRTIGGVEVPSVGFPLGDFEMRIRDDAGRDVPNGSVGEIWLRGTSVTPGYLTGTAGDGQGFRDGWLATGDLGAFDEAGRLYITGRKKDLIIHQGRNFYGHDIASRLEQLPDVRTGKVFVFGVESDGQERIVIMTGPPARSRGSAAASAGPDLQSSALDDYKQDIKRFVLREFGLPVHDVHVVRRIPKTTSGKIDRGQCVRIYRDSSAEAVS